ncbi:MAG: CoA pyrophosphatase, partial [Pseudomonadota bacterium]|nr:CoA pyrophosphatase [Pseudomonadota bacterium]
MTLEQFRTLFGRAAAPLDDTPGTAPRGDHDLNPGFTPRPEARPAAVLVPVVDRPDGATILLTRRS